MPGDPEYRLGLAIRMEFGERLRNDVQGPVREVFIHQQIENVRTDADTSLAAAFSIEHD